MRNKIIATIFVLSVFLFWHKIVFGMDWKTANQVTLAWNPVTSMKDGAVIPPEDSISYEVFSVPEIGDKALDLKLEGETLSTEMVISFIEEGRFYLGVRAVRSKHDMIISRSKIIWTDDPAVMKDGKAQGVIFFRSPGDPGNLEIK